jgi:nucleotide-binding universal stress UspA family protein
MTVSVEIPAVPAELGSATPIGRRVLAVLECCAADDAVLQRAIEVAHRSGGYLTLVVVEPSVGPWSYLGPYCVPRVTRDELRSQASNARTRAVSLVPPDIPLMTALDQGRPADVIRRRVTAAAHDLVVVARQRMHPRRLRGVPTVPVLAVDPRQSRRGPQCSSST